MIIRGVRKKDPRLNGSQNFPKNELLYRISLVCGLALYHFSTIKFIIIFLKTPSKFNNYYNLSFTGVKLLGIFELYFVIAFRLYLSKLHCNCLVIEIFSNHPL